MNTAVVGIQHDRVRDLRISKGYSIKNLAEKLNVKYQNIQNVEKPNGVKNPSYIAKLADALDVSINYLLGLEDTISPNTFTFNRLNFEFDSEHKINSNDVYNSEAQQQKPLTVDYDWISHTLGVKPTSSMKIVSPTNDKMKPFFGKNDTLLVDTEDTEAESGIYVYQDYNEINISRLQLIEGRLNGIPDNKSYVQTELSKGHKIYGRVIYLWSSEKL